MDIMNALNAPLYNAGNLREGDDSGIKVMLEGREGTLDNFRLFHSVNQEGGWEAPRHRHNFEQIRFPLSGGFEYAPDKVLQAGWVGYFPEGVYYGPQIRHKGLKMVVLQFGGASLSGYMSTVQRRRGFNELKAKGTFSKGVYSWVDEGGRKHNQDAFEATWEHINGRKLVYPRPRYDGLIMMDPAAYAWVDDPQQPGLSRKPLGTFTEREIRVDFVRLAAGASLDRKSTRLNSSHSQQSRMPSSA